jgi:hypothetical protein
MVLQKVAGHRWLTEIVLEKRIMWVDQFVTHTVMIAHFVHKVEIERATYA